MILTAYRRRARHDLSIFDAAGALNTADWAEEMRFTGNDSRRAQFFFLDDMLKGSIEYLFDAAAIFTPPLSYFPASRQHKQYGI